MTHRGTLEIDRVFTIRGRKVHVRLPSGTHDLKLREQLVGMLKVLAESRPDILEAIAEKPPRLRPLDVWPHYRVGNLASLALTPAEAMVQLFPAFGRWIDDLRNPDTGAPASEKHRASLRISLNHLAPHADTIDELPKAVAKARLALLPKRARTYQLVKAAALGFIRDLPGLGIHSDLYRRTAAVPGVTVTPREREGLPIEEWRKATAAMPPQHAAQAWAMALTGMMPDEYLARKFEVHPGRDVHILGTKRTARDRLVPYLAPISGPHTLYRALWQAMNDVALDPYDGRRSFAHWGEEAGIPRTRLKMYLGHKVRSEDVTGRYLFHYVRRYLPDDQRKLLAYIGQVPAWLKLEARA